MKRTLVSCRGWLALLAFPAALGAQPADFSTLDGKVLAGYQGWFNCPGDGDPRNSWRSWSRGVPAAGTLTIDMYPDLSEFDTADLCRVPGLTIGGAPAYLYSAWNPKIVDKHFEWMKKYGLDGVLVQRFVTTIEHKRSSGDVLLQNILAAARKHGRAIAIEYDVTGFDAGKFFGVMREDWQYLVDEVGVTRHPCYLKHNGKPVLSVWGMGLEDPRHPPREPGAALQVVNWFKQEAPEDYRVTYMGGVPARWRTLARDAQRDEGWRDVYAAMDVIQPWTVGRYNSLETADRWLEEELAPDLAATRANNQLYMPVVFPGFSWHNLKPDTEPNRIPRLGGRFLRRQAENALKAGARMLKIAMFDEVNEGTAIYKLAARRQDAPDQGFWLTLDADGEDLPSDFYLKLAGEITALFHAAARPE